MRKHERRSLSLTLRSILPGMLLLTLIFVTFSGRWPREKLTVDEAGSAGERYLYEKFGYSHE